MSKDSSTKLVPDAAPVVLKDRYELHEILGEGGMGRVHRGFDRVLKRAVAVKVLTDLDSPMMMERFEREAKTLSQLNHPNLAAIYDFGMAGTQSFIIMEFIEGKSLDHWITENKGMETRKAVTLMTQIGEGLAAAHEKGIVHRDIKPENIIICQRGGKDWAEVVDFGIALSDTQVRSDDRLTIPGYTVGTPRYMAPEQLDGKIPTTSADIFSFGLVCAEMLGGEKAVNGGRLRSSMTLESPAARYWPVIERACHEEPSGRWPDIRSMLEAIAQAAPDSIPKEPQTLKSSQKTIIGIFRKKRTVLAVIALSVFLCLSMTFFLLWRDYIKLSPSIPIVSIEGIHTTWISKDELQVQIAGEIQKAQPRRMLLEIAACDSMGNRIPDKSSQLVDQALGSILPLDVIKPPQPFQKTFNLRIQNPIHRGYISVTIFNHEELLVAQQNSAFWPEQVLK